MCKVWSAVIASCSDESGTGRCASRCYLYAETSGYVGSTIQKIGNRGGIMLPDLLGMRLAVFLAVFVPLLVLGLFVVAQLAP